MNIMKKIFMISVIAALSISMFAADDNKAVVTFTPKYPTGAVNEKALFSVASGKQVYFSQGNLQHKASTKEWRFALNQYDFVGNGSTWGNMPGNDNNQMSATYSGWVDLFCWASSGYHDTDDSGNRYYGPYTINNNEYGGGYGPSTTGKGIEKTNYDWGVYLPISNGGNEVGQWRTLTDDEWIYLVNRSGNKYTLATVCSTLGLILLPDVWPSTCEVPITVDMNNYTTNTYNSTQWDILESYGAVFLPSAGMRNPESYYNDNQCGKYWLTSTNPTIYNPQNYARSITIQTSYALDNEYRNVQRSYGLSVRLVRDK